MKARYQYTGRLAKVIAVLIILGISVAVTSCGLHTVSNQSTVSIKTYNQEYLNPITEFKYLSASNFKDGAAKGILLVPAAGVAQLQPDDWRMVFTEYYGYPFPTQGFSDPLPVIGDSMAMMARI